MTAAHPILGLRRRTRANNMPFMVAVVDADLLIPASAEIHLHP